MREIKFRAWDNKEKKWYQPTHRAYEGELFELMVGFGGDLLAHTMNGNEHESLWPDRYNLMQYTGLKDKNGKEIYEGDVIESNDGENRFVIKWEKGAFIRRTLFITTENGEKVMPLDPIYTLYESVGIEKAEIIGNIYENPELLNN